MRSITVRSPRYGRILIQFLVLTSFPNVSAYRAGSLCLATRGRTRQPTTPLRRNCSSCSKTTSRNTKATQGRLPQEVIEPPEYNGTCDFEMMYRRITAGIEVY